MSEPTTCLLHADCHVMSEECWGATLKWFFEHDSLSDRDKRNAYQAAVERRMLDAIRLGRAVDQAVPAAIDRAVRRDHSLCGVDPCSDCR